MLTYDFTLPEVCNCSQQKKQVAKDKHISVYFDREKLSFVGLEESHMKQLRDAYPGVDIDHQLEKMGCWLLSSRGCKRKGTWGFIVNWLNNSTSELKPKQAEQNTCLIHHIDEYLQRLWKGREHILTFNKR